MTTSDGAAPHDGPQFLAGDSKMARRIRGHDWADHPLGSPSGWPQSLRSALSICLHSALPTAIYWGPELRLLYNDAWAPIPGPRHPAALGAPAAEVWADIWHVIAPQFDGLLQSGEGFSVCDQLLPMRRFGVPEKTYWNYSFTPIRDEKGAIGGIFNTGNETTDIVLWQRKTAFLLELGEALRSAREPLDARRRATELLGAHLGADRLGFVELDRDGETITVSEEWDSGRLPPLERTHAGSDFGHDWHARLAAGQPIRIDDIERMPEVEPRLRAGVGRLGVRALLAIPWIEGGRLRAALFAHALEPRTWTEHDATAARQTLDWVWSAIERARAAERERMLAREIDHRAKNALAVVLAVTRLTDGTTIEDFRSRLEARVGALARSHNLLAAGRWTAVDLRTLVEEELKPFLAGGGPAVALDGPSFDLEPEFAQTVALALHELTTNAVKHGALSGPGGSLGIAWRRDASGSLELDWVERGLRAESGGEHTDGFGSELLRRSIEHQLGGTIDLDWQDGLPHYRIVLPLDRSGEEVAREGAPKPGVPGTPAAGAGDPPIRILVAEDEPLVALEMEDRLTSFGYAIFAMTHSVAGGLTALEGGTPDVAVLDADLGGESSVALAERLHAKGVPVVFATGYDTIDGLPTALADAPLLSKPVADATLLEALKRVLGAPADVEDERSDAGTAR